MDKPFHTMSGAERIAARIAKNRAMEERIAQRIAEPGGSLRHVKVSFTRGEAVGFSHADTFPRIAAVVKSLCGEGVEYIGHREIVLALVDDAELGWLLDQIVGRDPDGRSTHWWANNMMSWFSQTFTQGRNPYSELFERDENSEPYGSVQSFV